jgi:MoaA/NifB/PqqE/SkfB family radical SAM enzyme
MGFLWNYLRNFLSITCSRQPNRPLLFSYYVTHRCGLACSYCSDGEGRPFKDDIVDELPTEKAKRLIGILRQSCDTLDITGGEPMLRQDLEDLLAYSKQIGFRTILNTKGLDLHRRPDVLKFSDVIVLSIDSLNMDRLAQISNSPPETAANIIHSLRWLLENRNDFKSHIVVSAVAAPDNLDDVFEIVHLAKQNKLGFQLSPQIVGTSVHPGLQANERFRSLVNEVIAAKTDGAAVWGIFPYLYGIRDFHSYRCYPLLMPTIRPDGTVNLPCLEKPQKRIDLIAAGSYEQALADAGIAGKSPPDNCHNQCHIFCHMAISLLQQHPLSALRELFNWQSQP